MICKLMVFYRLEEHLSHVHNYIFCAKSVGFGATYEHAVFTQMNSLEHLPLCPYDLPLCVSLHSKLHLCLETQKYNVARPYNVHD